MECVFCNFKDDPIAKIVKENEYCVLIQYIDSIPEGSSIIVPKAHRETMFNLSKEEWDATYDLLHETKMLIDKEYKPDGYNVGWNIGKVGGQEVFHAHLHIIPRYSDEFYAGKGIRYWLKQPENRRKIKGNKKSGLDSVKWPENKLPLT